MNRFQWVLAAVLAAELATGAVLFRQRWNRPTPPVAELSYTDPLLADQIRDLIRKCRTPDDWARLGEIYLAYGYFPEAEACYRVAAQGAPASPDHAYNWGFALERIGQLEEANREYERAIALGHPRPEDCWYYIGKNGLRQEKAEEAREAFQKAGNQPSARYEYARLMVRSGTSREAIPLLDKLAAEHPQAVQPYLLRYRIEVFQGGALEGVYADKAGRAMKVLPSPWYKEFKRLEDVHDELGVAGEWLACKEMLAKGEHDEAEPRLRHAHRLWWDPAGIDLLAKVEARHRRLGEAINLLQEVIDRAGPSVHFLTRLGDMYEQTGQLDRAVEAWSRAVQLGFAPGAKYQDYQHRKLAAYYERKGDKEAARRHLALAYYATGHEAFWDDELSEDRKLPAARRAFEQAVEFDPGSPHAWFYVGETRRLLNEPEDARQAYKRCLEINPDHGRALAGLALLGTQP
jgi:tetratricopeptide (TPR) repeat protein